MRGCETARKRENANEMNFQDDEEGERDNASERAAAEEEEIWGEMESKGERMRGNVKDWGEQTKSKNEETKREIENEDKERERERERDREML